MENSKRKELQKEAGIGSVYRLMKRVLWIAGFMVFSSVIITCFVVFGSQEKVRELSKSVVVIDGNGNTYLGRVNEVNESDLSKMKAKNVLMIGVDYMYSFSASNYDARLEMAKSYFGSSQNEILMTYKNQNVREKVMQNDLSVDVVIKSVNVDFNNGILVGEVVFEQAFVNGSAVKKRTITATCTFEAVKPTSENSTGLVIENWLIKSQS